jgi:hypothetical protein
MASGINANLHKRRCLPVAIISALGRLYHDVRQR